MKPQVLQLSVLQARKLLGEDGLKESLAALGLSIDLGAVQDGDTGEEKDAGEEKDEGGDDGPPEDDELQPQADESPKDEAEATYDHDQGDATSEWADAIYRAYLATREE